MEKINIKSIVITGLVSLIAIVAGSLILNTTKQYNSLYTLKVLAVVIVFVLLIIGLYYHLLKGVNYFKYMKDILSSLSKIVFLPIRLILVFLWNTIEGLFYIQYLSIIIKDLRNNKPIKIKTMKAEIIDDMKKSLKIIFSPPRSKKGQITPILIIALIIIIILIIIFFIRGQ